MGRLQRIERRSRYNLYIWSMVCLTIFLSVLFYCTTIIYETYVNLQDKREYNEYSLKVCDALERQKEQYKKD